MLLVELTINGTLTRVSVEGHALVNNWKPLIIGFDAPTLVLPSDHGGYAKMSFGSISFNPLLFAGDWPPPISCPISIYYTDTTEAARETVFEGTAHLSAFDREGITYALYGPSYDELFYIMGVAPLVTGRTYQIIDYVAGDDFANVGGTNVTGNIFTASGTTPTTWTNFSQLAPHWDDDLNTVIADVLSVIPEITVVDTTYARASSPNVTYTLTSNRIAINVASDIAEFYSHLIYVVGTTAYLVDMKRDNGTWVLTEYKFFAFPRYQYKAPLALLTCSYGGIVYSQASSYPYGQTSSVEPYHTTQGDIEAALANILAIENAARVTFSVPMIAGNFPKLGQKITIPDTGNVVDLNWSIRARKLQYDFIENTVTIDGERVVAQN
jgi:hypothetical protein